MENNSKKSIAERLTAVIEETGLTREEFAEAVGFSRSTIYHWEKGEKDPLGKNRRYLNEVLDRWELQGKLLNHKTGECVISSKNQAISLVAESDYIGGSGADHGLSAAHLRAVEAVRVGGDPTAIVSPELSRGELLIMEYGAWVRRRLLKQPELIDELELAQERFRHEFEQGRSIALKAEIAAHPEEWEERLLALVEALPAGSRQRFVGKLELGGTNAGGAKRKPNPARKPAAGGEAK